MALLTNLAEKTENSNKSERRNQALRQTESSQVIVTTQTHSWLARLLLMLLHQGSVFMHLRALSHPPAAVAVWRSLARVYDENTDFVSKSQLSALIAATATAAFIALV